MKWMSSFAILSMALQGNPPVKPVAQFDPRDPKSIVDHAIFNTRTQKCYETAYTAQLTTPAGVIDYKGRSVWVAPGILYLHFTATGKDEQKIVRAGEKDVWVHHSLAGWGTDAEAGKVGYGRGIQNPDEILSMLANNTDTAKLLKPGLVAVTFNGQAIARIMRNLVPGGINPNASTAVVRLEVDETVRIRKLTCTAAVALVGNGGINRYTSEVTVVAYNDANELKFSDEKSRPIPLLPEMKDRIDSVLNGNK
jgi:hypothetical protein